eukprot:TRINITY_DN7761_c0_g1_i1.p1 TRINITY_DN7761_c0_g1~~TRINITY_DN7761_c0_g1_i1.p1  ORF type:complete len:238 (-),score=44.10 TRINITY_DN7761_c0_g1_i1:670-1383(-)
MCNIPRNKPHILKTHQENETTPMFGFGYDFSDTDEDDDDAIDILSMKRPRISHFSVDVLSSDVDSFAPRQSHTSDVATEQIPTQQLSSFADSTPMRPWYPITSSPSVVQSFTLHELDEDTSPEHAQQLCENRKTVQVTMPPSDGCNEPVQSDLMATPIFFPQTTEHVVLCIGRNARTDAPCRNRVLKEFGSTLYCYNHLYMDSDSRFVRCEHQQVFICMHNTDSGNLTRSIEPASFG